MHAVIGGGRLIAGRYRLQGPIGRGAMGIVWRGRDELLARDVAVKEVQITAQASPTDAEAIYQRTLREARTAARLSHPSVVTVFDVVEENGTPWIVMELVNARSLDRVITEDGPLPPLQAAELGTSLIGALATAHSAGVLHRDVKPSNVLVADDGKAVLTDFGIATFAEDPGITQVGMVVGTPGFTAPERVRGEVATPASDLWSLGATLYAAVEGRGPFDRVGGSSVITAGVATEEAPRAPSAGPLAPVIDALLSRDPGTRPDATTASRLLAEATTAARTGTRSLGDGWLAAEASTAERDAVSVPDIAEHAEGSSAADEPGPGDPRAAFLDPPVFTELSMPDLPGSGDAVDVSLGSLGSGETPLVAAGQFAEASLGIGAGLGIGVGLGLAGDAAMLGDAEAARGTGALEAPDPHPGTMLAADAPDLPRLQAGQGGDTAPVLWEPVKPVPGGAAGSAAAGSAAAGGLLAGLGGSGPGGPGSGGSGSGGSGPGGSGGTGPGGDDDGGGMRFRRRGGPSRPSSGRWRLMVAGAGITAIAVAAVVGWDIYTHTQTTQALGTTAPPSTTAPGGRGSGPAKAGSSGSPGSGGDHGSAPAAGASGPTTASRSQSPGNSKPSSVPSGKPGSTTSSGPGTSPSPSASSSPSATPSPSPTPSKSPPPVLPPGYVWHHFSAAVMGSTAGFEIGLPALWTQSVAGLVAHLDQSARDFHLTVNLGLWTYVEPLPQAQYLQRKDAKADNGYKELSLGAIGFKTVGGFEAASAAELKFSWHKPLVGNFTELVVLVTLSTKSGVQPYTFTLWAPSATFNAANGIFHTAMTTFRPLPG